MTRIAILETGHNPAALEPRFGRFSTAFRNWLAAHGEEFRIELDVYWVEGGEFPAQPGAYDGYIITGSAAGVYEDHAWLEPTREFLRAALAADRKLLGVCFGHQLLADVLGGKVVKSDKGWGIGRHTYALHQDREWMDPPLGEISLLACHQDQVVELPAGAEVLASSAFCEYAMFAVGDNVLTVQAHPEFSLDYANALYEHRRARFGDDVTDRGLSSLTAPTQHDVFARWALRFLCGAL
jgi:GMP synthase-like glutamine amidotransferase